MIWKGRLVFAREYGSPVIPYTKLLKAPRSTPSDRLAGLPEERCGAGEPSGLPPDRGPRAGPTQIPRTGAPGAPGASGHYSALGNRRALPRLSARTLHRPRAMLSGRTDADCQGRQREARQTLPLTQSADFARLDMRPPGAAAPDTAGNTTRCSRAAPRHGHREMSGHHTPPPGGTA